MEKFLAFLNQLEARKIAYRLSHARSETVMVEIALPGERWEVEFFANGEIDIEVFRSDGKILEENAIENLWQKAD